MVNGIHLVFISLNERIYIIKRLIKIFIKYETLYLMIMGILHGITNLGGSLLSAIIFNKNLSKDSKRATIAVCYLTFAAFQIITIAITFNNNALFNELKCIN